MRIRTWSAGAALAAAGLVFGVLVQHGFTQPGEEPSARPNALPPSIEQTPVTTLPPPPSLPEAPRTVVTLPPPVESPRKVDLPHSVTEIPPPVAAPQSAQPPVPQTIKILQPANAPVSAPAANAAPAAPATVEDFTPQRGRFAEGVDLLAPRTDNLLPPIAAEVKLAPRQEPSVSVEWIGTPSARLNQPFTCQILVRNTGQATVHNVAVRHRLSPGVVCKRTEPAAATDHDDIIWTIGSLQAGQQRRIELQLVATQRGTVDCQATVSFASVAGQQVQIREPKLLVQMRVPDKAIGGEKVNILFAVANPGDGVAEAVKVKAILPDGLDTTRGRIFDIDIGNLEPRESRTMQIPCTAKTSGVHKCTLVATAEGNIMATEHGVTEVLEAKLDVAMAGPKLRYIDRHATYQIRVTNPGTAPAAGVTLNEVVPAGFKFHSATSGGRWNDNAKTVSWDLGDLLPGQTRDVTVDLLAVAAGDHRLQAQVSSNRGARTEASAVTRVEGSSNLVVELADVDDPVEVGGETTYEIRITNAGTKVESNLEVVCTLPAQEEFKNARSIAGIRHRLEGREVVFDPLPRLAPRADVIYRVTVRGAQAGDARFRIRVRADGITDPIVRDENTRFYNDTVLPR